MNSNLILASASPRRKELLELLRIPFEVIKSDIEEIVDEKLHPGEWSSHWLSKKQQVLQEQIRTRL